MSNTDDVFTHDDHIENVTILLNGCATRLNKHRVCRKVVAVAWFLSALWYIPDYDHNLPFFVVINMALVLGVVLLRAVLLLYMRHSNMVSHLAWWRMMPFVLTRPIELDGVSVFVNANTPAKWGPGSYARMTDQWKHSLVNTQTLFAL